MNLTPQNATADNLPWPVTMRFGTVLLACVLLALSAGQSLTAYIANLCYLSGLCGMAFYFCLEFVANQRSQTQAKAVYCSAEQRLSRCLRTKNAVAASHREASAQEQATGDIESAMDSKADFETYVGLQTQPALSV